MASGKTVKAAENYGSGEQDRDRQKGRVHLQVQIGWGTMKTNECSDITALESKMRGARDSDSTFMHRGCLDR